MKNADRPNIELVWVPTDSIKLHPENPRDGDVGAIITSIGQNGWYGALVVQKSSGHVLVGNHRLKAINQLGWAQVPVIYLDVDDRRARNIMLADNKVSDGASYHEDILAELLAAAAADGDLLATGYDDEDLSKLMAPEFPEDLMEDKPEKTCPNCGHVLTAKAQPRPRRAGR